MAVAHKELSMRGVPKSIPVCAPLTKCLACWGSLAPAARSNHDAVVGSLVRLLPICLTSAQAPQLLRDGVVRVVRVVLGWRRRSIALGPVCPHRRPRANPMFCLDVHVERACLPYMWVSLLPWAPTPLPSTRGQPPPPPHRGGTDPHRTDPMGVEVLHPKARLRP